MVRTLSGKINIIVRIQIRIAKNQTKISNWLKALRNKDARKSNEVDYAALERLTTRIKQLATMAKSKDREDETKVQFFTRAVM